MDYPFKYDIIDFGIESVLFSFMLFPQKTLISLNVVYTYELISFSFLFDIGTLFALSTKTFTTTPTVGTLFAHSTKPLATTACWRHDFQLIPPLINIYWEGITLKLTSWCQDITQGAKTPWLFLISEDTNIHLALSKIVIIISVGPSSCL